MKKHTILILASLLFLFLSFFLALSTVFLIDNRLAHGVISGKYFWFYGSMGLVVIATVIHAAIRKQPFRFSTTDCFVLLFAGSVFIPAFAFTDTATNTTKLTLFALLLVLYFCLRLVLTSNGIPRQARNDRIIFICIFIIITGLVEAVWGLQQLYGFKSSQHGLFKLTGSFFNPGPYAGYLAVVFPLALHYWINKKQLSTLNFQFSTLNSYLACIVCIAIFLALPAAMSRASWLAAIAGSTVVVIAGLTRNPLKNIKQLLTNHGGWRIKSAMTSCVVALLLLVALTGMYRLKQDSADGRLLTWKVSLAALADNPLGVGLGRFPGAYGEAQAAYFASGKASSTEEYVAGNLEYGFNEFLQIGIESGIVALLLFTGLLASAFRGLAKAKDWGLMGSLIALLVFACFSYPFSVLPFPIILVFLLAMSATYGTQMTRIRQVNTDFKLLSASIRSICVICVLSITAFCLWKQYPVYEAYKQWNRHRMYYQAGMFKETVQSYEPLYPYLSDRIQFLFEYGRSLSQLGINDSRGTADHVRHDRLNKSNEILQQAAKISCDPMLYNIMGRNYQAMQEYGLAEENLLQSTRIVPNRLYPYYLLMKLHVETGNEAKAREAAGTVLTKEPKVQSQAVREMREEARIIMNYEL
jgi:tetratricopeptide (TPR) repeat protein